MKVAGSEFSPFHLQNAPRKLSSFPCCFLLRPLNCVGTVVDIRADSSSALILRLMCWRKVPLLPTSHVSGCAYSSDFMSMFLADIVESGFVF
ncbi:hypothetical protein AVEN_195333-1 [Araneus ventricosus]|uniref:Uncharacterized protein n=1 Tax=Araneus ventricosus TaxID=182803 RepID=A0A4Y2LHH5_ARAVE|nr:hypothetical protein AVEN_195333-1 [Araneus ventricosus]